MEHLVYFCGHLKKSYFNPENINTLLRQNETFVYYSQDSNGILLILNNKIQLAMTYENYFVTVKCQFKLRYN